MVLNLLAAGKAREGEVLRRPRNCVRSVLLDLNLSTFLRVTTSSVLIALAVCLVVAPSASAVDPDPPAPSLSIDPKTVEVSLAPSSSDTSVQTTLPYFAYLNPVFSNSGGAGAVAHLSVALAKNSADCKTSSVAVAPDRISIPRYTSVPVLLTLTFPDGCAGESGTLVANVDGGPPALAAISVGQTLSQPTLWWPVAAALLVGAFFVAFSCLHWGREDVYAGSGWSFKDSWVTNVSALGAVLVTVLGATGLLGTLLPGINTSYLVGLSVLFGSFVLAAPIIYSAMSKWAYESGPKPDDPPQLVPTGSGWGIALAGGATVAGVAGQFATLWVVTLKAQVPIEPKLFVYALLVAGIILVVFHGINFVSGVTVRPPAPLGLARDRPSAAL